ncbi:PEP-CTERM sorting domain-containing protein [Candidatus Uabimicrobium amorphum]|uniref:PEP-CTERM sorting domain-containing protein n=1 Tax=Uabimicrobium amorphum TaxID=2596890 RepID=UPI0012600798
MARAIITPIAPTNGSIFIDTLTVGTAVPETSTYALLSMLVALGFLFRRKRRQH